MNDVSGIDIAPDIRMPDCKEWQALALLRQALEHPPMTKWELRAGEFTIVCNETLAIVLISDPIPFEVEPRSAILVRGQGALGYVRPSGAKWIPRTEGAAILALLIEETCRERRAILERLRPTLFANRPVCEGCGVPIGDDPAFPGDSLRPDRSGGVCQQCLTFGTRTWLNQEPRRDWHRA